MLQFDGIQLLLLVLAVTAYSNQVFETNRLLPISIIAQIRNTDIKDQTTQNQLLDNQSQLSDDKNEVNNFFLIEPPQKSIQVFSQKSLLVENQPEEILKEQSSNQNESELSKELNDEQKKISIKISQKQMKDTGILQDNNLDGQHSIEKEELQSIQNDKISTKISQENQVIESNDETEIIIKDIKIESIHEEPVSKIEDNKSQNEDVIIIKTDEEIKATPRVFGVLNNDQIKQESLEEELSLENEKDQEEIEQCEGEELDTIHSQKENKRQESNKLTIEQKKDRQTAKKTNEKNKKLSSNVLSNNKKQQSSKRNQQQQKDQNINTKEVDQKLIGEIIKVQAEVEDVDLSIFADDHSDLIPIIVEDSEQTLVDDTDNQLQEPQSQQQLNEINNQDTIIEVNQELNQDQIEIDQIANQNQDIDGGSFEDFQSELDELSRELDQLSLDSTQNSNDSSENLEEESSNESLQYITISTNNDPIIVNTLEDDYFLDDLDNELGEQSQQQDQLHSALESTNEQQEVEILIVNDPEQLIIQKEYKDKSQSSDENQIESQIEEQFNGESSQENQVIITIDNNDQEISIKKQIQDSDENQIENDFKQPLQLDNDMEMEQHQFEQSRSNEFEDVDMKKNSIIKKEVSAVDNMIANENINDQIGQSDDDFLRIAAETEAEVIENLEDLQDSMEIVQFDKKVQNQLQAQPDKYQRPQKYIDNNKEYSLKIDQNRKQSRVEEDHLDQIKNTQIRDQYQKGKEDDFNQMINDLINEFDFKNQREREIIYNDRQITQHIIDNMEELRYANRVFNRDLNEQNDEELCEEEVNNDQEFQEAYTVFQKVVQNKEEFERECNDDQTNKSVISDYEKDIDKRKKEVIDKIKKELMLKKERLKNNNNNNQRSDNLSTYDFERIYLDWATNKEDIVYNILLHTTNSDIESQTLEEVKNTKVERISKKQEVDEELQKLYSNYERDRKGQHLRGQR